MKRELERLSEELTPSEEARLWFTIREETRRAIRRRAVMNERSVRIVPAAAAVGALCVAFGWLLLSIGRVATSPVDPQGISNTTTAMVTSHAAAGTPAETPAADSTVRVPGPAATDAATAPGSPAGAPAPDPNQPGTIRGFVRERHTGRPLAPANLLIEGTPWGAMSGEDGSFVVNNVPAGAYRLRAEMMGYESARDSIDVGPGDLAEVEFDLRSKIVKHLDSIRITGRRKRIDARSTETRASGSPDALSGESVDRIEEVIGLQAGVIVRDGQVHFRGGRAGSVQAQIDGSPAIDPRASAQASSPSSGAAQSHGSAPGPAPAGGLATACGRAAARFPSGTGGERPVNDQLADDMFFEHAGTNPFIDPAEDSLSTFGLDVDTGSYTIARRYLGAGHLPPPAAVRVEEFVNFFRHEYAPPADGDFAIHVDGLRSPFTPTAGENYRLLRVGIRGRIVETKDRTPAQIVLVIDTSGSMESENRLGLVKSALGVLLDELREDDEIGIVSFSHRAETILPMTPLTRADEVRRALDRLRPHGSTNAEDGLLLGYEMMRAGARNGRIHRIILCSDGVANVGRTGPESILARIRADAETITLTALGFGMGNYNDVLMEKLADAGDGQYAYIDDSGEAVRVLRENLTGTLQVIARNAKAQVEFDPARVDRYRLLGYENRDVRDADFRNNRVDAGEIGAGHEVTALYEIRLRDGAAPGRLATVRLRYERPERGNFVELERPIDAGQVAAGAEQAPPGLVLDACVAEFAEILRQSYWARESSPAAVLDVLRRLPESLRSRPDVAEFNDLVERAGALAR